MTIAVCLKVNDGIVLAADSATSLADASGNVGMVYNNANKTLHLKGKFSAGIMTYGLGAIAGASIATIGKDFRRAISPLGPDPSWHVDPDNYTLQEVAEKFKRFVYDERYVPAFRETPAKPVLGFLVAGYTAYHRRTGMAEAWEIMVDEKGGCNVTRVMDDAPGWGLVFRGQPHALHRLFAGCDLRLFDLMASAGIDPAARRAVKDLLSQLRAPLIRPAMPIQDAIDLADFLVDVAKSYARFSPGHHTIGGPTETAAITKHEGFKWVQRKYYYEQRLQSPDVSP